MATNPSNSNAINIAGLGQAQLVVDGDLFVLETPNGTQTIDFENLNVVKTDIIGNATMTGNLTGRDALFSTVQVVALTASEVYTLLGQGINAANDFYDRFTIHDGIVLSATRNTLANPIYQQITQTILPNTTAYMLTLFRRTADEVGTAYFDNGDVEATVSIPNFFAKYPWLNVNILQNNLSYFILSPVPGSINTFNQTRSQLVTIYNAIAFTLNNASPPAGSLATLQNSLTSLIFTVPALSSMPVVPFIKDGSVQQPTTTNDLRFTIALPFPYTNDVLVQYRVLVTG